jgi:hypothetical protein
VTRIYLNAQFSDGHNRPHLLSVGMVSELGEFYRIVDDADAVNHALKNEWIREHVLQRLPLEVEGREWHWTPEDRESRSDVRDPRIATGLELIDDLIDFVDSHPEPELWGWQSAYAYTLIRRLFGKITDRPANFPLWCGELAAKWSQAGRPELPERGAGGHHALEMARWARDVDAYIDRIDPVEVAALKNDTVREAIIAAKPQ